MTAGRLPLSGTTMTGCPRRRNRDDVAFAAPVNKRATKSQCLVQAVGQSGFGHAAMLVRRRSYSSRTISLPWIRSRRRTVK